MRSCVLLLVLVVAIVASSVGCATSTAADRAKLLALAQEPKTEANYSVAPPDQLNIEVKGYPEYTRTVIVRPDGKITVPSIGDIYVQGLTMPEITSAVVDGLTKELASPNVTVSLVAASSKAIYVLGEVKSPGSLPYYGDMTLVDAIGSAKGLSFYGDMTNIRLTRLGPDGAQTIVCINLKKLIDDGSPEENVVLREGDIIYVSPTPFAKVGYAFDQVLYPFRSILSGMVTYGGVKNAID
jgi:polysaccharide export outer membrane protein